MCLIVSYTTVNLQGSEIDNGPQTSVGRPFGFDNKMLKDVPLSLWLPSWCEFLLKVLEGSQKTIEMNKFSVVLDEGFLYNFNRTNVNYDNSSIQSDAGECCNGSKNGNGGGGSYIDAHCHADSTAGLIDDEDSITIEIKNDGDNEAHPIRSSSLLLPTDGPRVGGLITRNKLEGGDDGGDSDSDEVRGAGGEREDGNKKDKDFVDVTLEYSSCDNLSHNNYNNYATECADSKDSDKTCCSKSTTRMVLPPVTDFIFEAFCNDAAQQFECGGLSTLDFDTISLIAVCLLSVPNRSKTRNFANSDNDQSLVGANWDVALSYGVCTNYLTTGNPIFDDMKPNGMGVDLSAQVPSGAETMKFRHMKIDFEVASRLACIEPQYRLLQHTFIHNNLVAHLLKVCMLMRLLI